MHSPSKIILFLILSCAFLGGYAGIFISHQHGFLDALRVCVTDSQKCVFEMMHSPLSAENTYTNIARIDTLINVLIEFFAQGLMSNNQGLNLEAVLASTYLAAQFGGAWFLMALEGLRVGNSGSLLSWTGTFGLVFQVATITVIAPIYLTLQLLFSPEQPEDFLVELCDLDALPLSTFIAYFLPTIALGFPLLNLLSRQWKYFFIGLWQPFPLYQTIIQTILRRCSKHQQSRAGYAAKDLDQYRVAFGTIYRFILCLTMGVHLFTLGTIIISTMTDTVRPISATAILGLTSLLDPPTLKVLTPPVSAADSRAVVTSFLRWDVYCTCASLAIWAAYALHRAEVEKSGMVVKLRKVIFWAAVGGPIAPAVMLLGERDALILDRLDHSRRMEKVK